MTDRDKQIEEASVEYQMSTRPNAIGGSAFGDLVYRANINPSFIAGAKWSDEHIRKVLVDIDKACEWIISYVLNHDEIDIFEMEQDFKQAMEEQLWQQ